VENNALAIPIWNSSINYRIGFIISIRNFTQSEVAIVRFATFLFRAEDRDQQSARGRGALHCCFEHEKPALIGSGNSNTVGTWSTFHYFQVKLKAEFRGEQSGYVSAGSDRRDEWERIGVVE
jgi:hypothetical protein